MKRILALLLALGLGAVAPVAAQGNGMIIGTVTDAVTGQPLEGVRVTVEGSLLVTTTSPRGTWRLIAVPSGERIVVFSGIRRVTERRNPSVPADGEITVDVSLRETPIVMTDVVVTATREEEKRSEVAATVDVVDRTSIDQTRPHHPAELMSQVPGALVVDLGGEGNTMALRQPINYKPVYAYLEDGVPIRSTGFFNHNAMYEMNLPGAERVEVFKGPASALYGSDAIGGVVNVLTRAPSATPSVELFAEGGRYGYKRSLVSASNTFGANGLRADLNVTHYDGYRDGTEQERESANLRWDRGLGSNTRLKTVLAFSNINSPGDGGSDVSRADYENDPQINYTPIAFRKVRAARWSTGLEKVGEDSRFSVTGYARYDRLELLPSWQLTYDPEVWKIQNYSVGLMFQGRKDFTPLRTRITGGLDLDLSPGTHQSDSITPVTSGSSFTDFARSERIYDYDVTFRSISPYLQAEFSPLARVRVTGGLRYDRLGYNYDNQLGVLETGNHRRPASTTVWYDHLSPKLGVAVALSPSVSAFASYRHSFRVPSEDQLFRQGSADNTVDLDPVRANSYEAGIRARASDRVSVELSAYTMTVKDDILSFFNTVDFSSQTSNAGRTRHRGIEAGASLGLTDYARLEGSYTYVEHRYLEWVTATGTDYSGNHIESAPRHIANTRLVVTPFRRGSVAFEWQHLGGYFTDPENAHTYGGHDLFNLYFTQPVIREFDLVGRVNNLGNTRYANSTSFNPFVPAAQQERFTPGLPRSFFLGAQYRWTR
jgi:outer membrane receptor protein involved in Fe transport